MYRKFWLVNALTKTNAEIYPAYELTNPKEKHFLSNPEGLGFTKQYETEKLGNTENLVSQQFNLGDITGDLVFYDETPELMYKAYQEFIQYAKHAPLEFYQVLPNSTKEYFCKILFVSAKKSEVSHEDSALHINVTFHKLTEWVTKDFTPLELDSSIQDEEGKHYELIRPYYYSNTKLNNVPITNRGTSNVGFIIEISGNVVNPKFTLSQNNTSGQVVPYAICQLNGTFDFVRINSIENEQEIFLLQGDVPLTNPKQYRNLSPDGMTGDEDITFCKLKVGESFFNFTCGNETPFDGKVVFKWRDSYATV